VITLKEVKKNSKLRRITYSKKVGDILNGTAFKGSIVSIGSGTFISTVAGLLKLNGGTYFFRVDVDVLIHNYREVDLKIVVKEK